MPTSDLIHFNSKKLFQVFNSFNLMSFLLFWWRWCSRVAGALDVGFVAVFVVVVFRYCSCDDGFNDNDVDFHDADEDNNDDDDDDDDDDRDQNEIWPLSFSNPKKVFMSVRLRITTRPDPQFVKFDREHPPIWIRDQKQKMEYCAPFCKTNILLHC